MRELGLRLLESQSARLAVVALAFLCSLSPFVLIASLASILLYTVLALVTLRKGVQEGASLLLLPVLGFGLYAFWFGVSWVVLLPAFAYLLTVFAASVVLRARQSWHDVLLLLLSVGFAAVLVAYEVNPELRGAWLAFFTKAFSSGLAKISSADSKHIFEVLSQYATGIFVFADLLQVVLILVLARAWQASLFMKGGFKAEFQRIKLEQWVPMICLAPALLLMPTFSGILPDNWQFYISDLVIIGLLPLLITGLSLIHAYWHHRGWGRRSMILAYLLAFLFYFYFAVLLCFIAALDSVFDFRSRGAWQLAGEVPG